MKNSILFLFTLLGTLIVFGQENDNAIIFNETEFSLYLTTNVKKNNSINLSESILDSKKIIVSFPDSTARNNTHTIHSPKRALTLTEYYSLTSKRKGNEK